MGLLYSPFDGKCEELQNATRNECKLEIDKTMMQNLPAVCEEVVIRCDDALGPGGDYMKAYAKEPFFQDKDYLKDFIKPDSINDLLCLNQWQEV